MTSRTLSPQEAATRARCGRTSIMRALQSGQLRGSRDNEGRWQIEPEALDDWLSMRRSPDRQSPRLSTGQLVTTNVDTQETLTRLAVAEARVEMLTVQIEELRQDRDAWRAQAERLTSEPKPEVILSSPPLFERLLDRFRRGRG